MSPADDHEQPAPAKGQWFATTHWSVVLKAGQRPSPQAAEALEKLCRTYWYPLYAYVRRQGHDAPDAQDLTQAFFERFLEGNFLESVDRQKGKFRSFLLAALKHFLANQNDRVNAEKRGGGRTLLSLDDETAEQRYLLEPISNQSPENIFEQRWAVTLLEQALTRLREESAADHDTRQFDLLKTFLSAESGEGEYAAVAAQLGMTIGNVAVTVHRLRQRYREMIRSEVAQTVLSPADLDEEMHYLFTVLTQ
ncbi:MAG: sigma-70 family RNA polymerase sigma factor [Verrucomicrobia bacterium]|nr:sigma-70 family RNA polymerase sigma factor [Verrucomicrobiota bacterium]